MALVDLEPGVYFNSPGGSDNVIAFEFPGLTQRVVSVAGAIPRSGILVRGSCVCGLCRFRFISPSVRRELRHTEGCNHNLRLVL